MFGLTDIEMDVRIGGFFRLATNQVEALPGIHTEFEEYKVIEPCRRIGKSSSHSNIDMRNQSRDKWMQTLIEIDSLVIDK